MFIINCVYFIPTDGGRGGCNCAQRKGPWHRLTGLTPECSQYGKHRPICEHAVLATWEKTDIATRSDTFMDPRIMPTFRVTPVKKIQ
jgi:hypothetical protein